MIPFSLLWGGFVIAWEFMAVTQVSKAPGPVRIIFPLFGLPFVLVGLYLIFGRFFVDAYQRSRTLYAVTDDRIIIISGLLWRQVKSLPLRTLSELSLTLRKNGSGSITFGAVHAMSAFFPAGGWPGAGRYSAPSFDFIEGVKDVYDLIRAAQRGARTNS